MTVFCARRGDLLEPLLRKEISSLTLGIELEIKIAELSASGILIVVKGQKSIRSECSHFRAYRALH